jgi:predicted phage terminase large subunit-like protein
MPVKKLGEAEQLLVAKARASLGAYLALCHMTDDGHLAIPPKHLREKVLPALMDDSLGHTVIVSPPGSIKTNTMIGACAWWLGNNPWQHVGYVCNSGPKAEERSMVIRDLMERSPSYRAVFPQAVPDKTRGWAQTAWYLQRKNLTDKNPSFVATGTSGDILGARIHRFVFDDLADDENMKTELQRKSLVTRLEQTYMTRMDDPSLGRAIMIGNRWHEEDPCQWAINQGWTYIHIPALDDDGESYWPERWPKERLSCAGEHGQGKDGRCWLNPYKNAWEMCKKREMGEDGFTRMFQGAVTNDDTAVFKRGNWRTYKELPAVTRGGIFVDLAHDEKTTSDYTAITAVAVKGRERYWRHVIRRRMQFPEVVRAIKEMRARFDYPIIIEDISNSKPLIQQLQRELWGVIAWKLEGKSKQARAESASPSHEAGDWFLPEAGWTAQFIDEHAQFPFAKHDDLVDTSTMMHLYFSRVSPDRAVREDVVPYARYGGVARV